jgi:hypothetical protein
LFRNLSLIVSFKTDNTIGKLLAQNRNINQNTYNKCGVPQLTCHDCSEKYIGQTGSPFSVGFQEHFQNFKYGNGNSKFAQHLIDNKHSIARMEDIMENLCITEKGSMKNSLEGFHIHNVTRLDNQMNDKCTVTNNAIFDTIIHKIHTEGIHCHNSLYPP